MSERVQMLGHVSELRKQESRLRTEVDALRDKSRSLTLPHLDALELNEKAIVDTAAALGVSLSELKAVRRRIDILNRELGE